MLMSTDNPVLPVGELALSLDEILRYANQLSFPAALVNDADGCVSAEAALAVFETMGQLPENHLAGLAGITVRLADAEDGVVCRIVL
ncbi:MAG: hypothetical protein Q4C54_00865 [Clostridia bacterium]|nr:hypothetical protein [Clostridia bacterium]